MELITDGRDERLEVRVYRNAPDGLGRAIGDIAVLAASLRAALSRAEAAEAEVKIGAHLVATVGDKNRELENNLHASEARVAMLEKAQFRETPMVLDPNGDGQSYVTLGEYMDSAAFDAAKEG